MWTRLRIPDTQQMMSRDVLKKNIQLAKIFSIKKFFPKEKKLFIMEKVGD